MSAPKFVKGHVPRSVLNKFARKAYETERDSATLDESALQVLRNAHANQRNLDSWGPLARSTGDREASQFIIDWFAHTVADFAPLGYAACDTVRARCLFVKHEHVMRALRFYAEDGSPDHDYNIPSRDGWDETNSLSSLRTRHGVGGSGGDGGKLLDALPHWERIAFLLHEHHHWSVMFYIRPPADGRPSELKAPLLLHFDSTPELHAPRAIELTALLHAANLVPSTVKLQRAAIREMQPGNWQCGYAVMARLYQIGVATLERSSDDEVRQRRLGIDADAIVADRAGELRHFIAYILECHDTAVTIRDLRRRWARIDQPDPPLPTSASKKE